MSDISRTSHIAACLGFEGGHAYFRFQRTLLKTG